MTIKPVFFQDKDFKPAALLELEEDAARHVVQVLRMEVGEVLELSNGRGVAAECIITQTAKKRCTVRIGEPRFIPQLSPSLTLAIAFTKNAARNEWLLEKATELGVQRITPILTSRTERERFRFDRFKGILISAMMQSQQYWLPLLDEPVAFKDLLSEPTSDVLLLAHCIDQLPRKTLAEGLGTGKSARLFIGPEGDFTPEEVALAMNASATGIFLGNTRLRTETAAIAACAYFHLLNSTLHG